MRADGVLTTVDIETEHQRLAKQGFSDAGVPANRARTIPGAALDVLPRLTDGHYDLVFCDGDKREYADYLKEALRLLRPGGVVAFDNALWPDCVADPAQRVEETVAIRDLGRLVVEAEGLGGALGVRPGRGADPWGLVCWDGDKGVCADCRRWALRWLRPGGVVAFDNPLWNNRGADPAQRDEETVATRALGRLVVESEGLVPVLLPVGDGLLAIKKEWIPE